MLLSHRGWVCGWVPRIGWLGAAGLRGQKIWCRRGEEWVAGVDSDAHRALARESASASAVLLKNVAGLLPLGGPRRRLKTVAVIGPFADAGTEYLHSYNGIPSKIR